MDKEKLKKIQEESKIEELREKIRQNQEKRSRKKILFSFGIISFQLLIGILVVFFIVLPRVKEKKIPEYIPGPLVPLTQESILPIQLRQIEDARMASLQFLPEKSKIAQERQLEASARLEIPVEIENTIGMRFRLVPAGNYLKGSPNTEDGRQSFEDQVEAQLKRDIYVGKYEVTIEQWRKVMGELPPGVPENENPNYPVYNISWQDCRRFIAKLCEMENIPFGFYRLPLEEEWEYACRGGSTGAYCFGDDSTMLPIFANFNHRHSKDDLTEVGSFWPNAYGLYDMHGNVMEWCLDKIREYKTGNPLPGFPSHYKIEQWLNVRGGNWKNIAKDCRSARRFKLTPDSYGNVLGFRIVRITADLVIIDPDTEKHE